MKKISSYFLIVIAFIVMQSCNPEQLNVIFPGPQDYDPITSIPAYLLNVIGEENIHFGDNPPKLDSTYQSCNSFYVFRKDVALMQLIDSVYINEPQEDTDTTIDATHYYFKFSNHQSHCCSIETMQVNKQTGDTTRCSSDSVYVIGIKPDFTAYYYEYHPEESGKPTYANVITGTIIIDTIPVTYDSCGVVVQKDSINEFIDNYSFASYMCKVEDSLAVIHNCSFYVGTTKIVRNFPDTPRRHSHIHHCEWPDKH